MAQLVNTAFCSQESNIQDQQRHPQFSVDVSLAAVGAAVLLKSVGRPRRFDGRAGTAASWPRGNVHILGRPERACPSLCFSRAAGAVTGRGIKLD
jgi:hypothetical protein